MTSERRPEQSGDGRVTAAQVAALAGTSIATVSLVANGKTAGRVSAANIAKVQAAIDQLGYTVDHMARALVGGRSSIVVLIAPDLSNPYYGRVISSVAEGLGDRFQLLLSATHDGTQPEAEDVRRLMALRPAGVLVDAPADGFLRELPLGLPLVLLDAPGHGTAAVAVNHELRSGIDELVDHLAARGHRTIGYLDSVTGAKTFAERRRILRESAQQRGIRVIAGARARSILDGAAAATAFAGVWPAWRDAGVTAVVCATDVQAYGVLDQAHRLGIPVPGELAVTGFDDLPYSALMAPALTTVALHGDALGAVAVARLLEQIDGSGDAGAAADLRTALVIRDSS